MCLVMILPTNKSLVATRHCNAPLRCAPSRGHRRLRQNQQNVELHGSGRILPIHGVEAASSREWIISWLVGNHISQWMLVQLMKRLVESVWWKKWIYYSYSQKLRLVVDHDDGWLDYSSWVSSNQCRLRKFHPTLTVDECEYEHWLMSSPTIGMFTQPMVTLGTSILALCSVSA